VKITIRVATQLDGYTFALSPESRSSLSSFGKKSIPDQVYVGYDTKLGFEDLHGPMWEMLARLLTGLSDKEISSFRPIVFVDANAHVIHKIKDNE